MGGPGSGQESGPWGSQRGHAGHAGPAHTPRVGRTRCPPGTGSEGGVGGTPGPGRCWHHPGRASQAADLVTARPRLSPTVTNPRGRGDGQVEPAHSFPFKPTTALGTASPWAQPQAGSGQRRHTSHVPTAASPGLETEGPREPKEGLVGGASGARRAGRAEGQAPAWWAGLHEVARAKVPTRTSPARSCSQCSTGPGGCHLGPSGHP